MKKLPYTILTTKIHHLFLFCGLVLIASCGTPTEPVASTTESAKQNTEAATSELVYRPKLKLARAQPEHRQFIEKAYQFLEDGEYDAARKLLLPLGKQAFSDAELFMAYSYLPRLKFLPQTVEPDGAQGMYWLRRAADHNHPIAQSTLSLLLEGGGPDNVPPMPKSTHDIDFDEVYKYLRKSAEQGYASAQLGMGHAYQGGYGIEQDKVEAYKWFLLSATRMGNSQKMLGKETGTKVLNTALASMEDRNDLSPEEIELAKERAAEWERTHPDAFKDMDAPELQD